jgi:hypothetical protein
VKSFLQKPVLNGVQKKCSSLSCEPYTNTDTLCGQKVEYFLYKKLVVHKVSCVLCRIKFFNKNYLYLHTFMCLFYMASIFVTLLCFVLFKIFRVKIVALSVEGFRFLTIKV